MMAGLEDENAPVRLSVTRQAGGAVARVCLNRPQVRNAFDDVMIDRLTSTFAGLGRDSEVRAIVLSAEGTGFCAGADLNWMRQSVDYTFTENVRDAHKLAHMLRTIHDCPKPVIARVQGAAFGGGVGLVAACDIAVAVESARFCLSEARLGLLPAVISPFVLKKIGSTAAHRYFLTAEPFTAAQALEMTLISEVAADEASLDALIDHLLTAILANGPEAVAQCKVLIEHVTYFDWERAVDITTKLIAERRVSAEGQEGMRAFLEKRPPRWSLSQSESGLKTP